MTNEELQAILATLDPKAEVVFDSFEYGAAHGVRSVAPRAAFGYARGDGRDGYGSGWWRVDGNPAKLESQRADDREGYGHEVGPVVQVIVLREAHLLKIGGTDG